MTNQDKSLSSCRVFACGILCACNHVKNKILPNHFNNLSAVKRTSDHSVPSRGFVLFYFSPSTKKNNLIESVAALFLTSGKYSNVKCFKTLFFSFLKPIVFETMFCGRIFHWTCTEIKQSVSEISAWFVSFQTVIHHKSEYCDRKAIFKNP